LRACMFYVGVRAGFVFGAHACFAFDVRVGFPRYSGVIICEFILCNGITISLLILHMYVCMCTGVRVYWCMSVWMCGCMSASVYGCVGVWVHVCMGVCVRVRVYECMGVCSDTFYNLYDWSRSPLNPINRP